MSNWSESNGIILPAEKPSKPTQKQVADMYEQMHRYCPSCGSGNIEMTCIGYVFADIETAVDRNKAMCGCGWRGIVHELVDSRLERNSK